MAGSTVASTAAMKDVPVAEKTVFRWAACSVCSSAAVWAGESAAARAASKAARRGAPLAEKTVFRWAVCWVF